MKFTRLAIPDVVLIEPKVFPDSRGFFYEDYRKDLFEQNGIHADFVQGNHNRSCKGAIRGLHYQLAPRAQAKLIQAVVGEIFDVVVDLRKDSNTFGKHVAIHLSAENKKMLFIPAGFAHGFCALEDGTEVLYKVTDFYAPAQERGILWNDAAIEIKWPVLDVPYVLSEKDQKYPRLKDAQFD